MRDGQSTNIVGVAMCHEYTLPVSEPGSGRCAVRRHFEFGSLRVRMNGFNIQANLLSIRVMDMLLRQGDRMSPFACVFEENRQVIERLIARRHFALVPKPMPSCEMRTLRDYELAQAGAEPKPIAYLKPTMATLLDCANEVCRLRDAPLVDRSPAICGRTAASAPSSPSARTGRWCVSRCRRSAGVTSWPGRRWPASRRSWLFPRLFPGLSVATSAASSIRTARRSPRRSPRRPRRETSAPIGVLIPERATAVIPQGAQRLSGTHAFRSDADPGSRRTNVRTRPG